MEAATAPATFQFVERAIVKSDGRLIAGPAIMIATAGPAGAPTESNSSASGISKKVGIASGTAIIATTMVARNCPRVEAITPIGIHNAIAIEIKTPIPINGNVLTATCPHECRKRSSNGRVSSALVATQLTGLTSMNLSIRAPVKNTAQAETTTLVVANL